jgi:hypothetical protein
MFKGKHLSMRSFLHYNQSTQTPPLKSYGSLPTTCLYKITVFNDLQGGPNIAKSFLAKKFGNIGTFGNIGHFRQYGNKNKLFCSKNEKRVGVGNDVICRTIFQFYKEFHDRFE